MNFETYCEIDAVNFSSLKLTAVSPKHYKYWLEHKRPDSPAMLKGRRAHTAVLEPDELLRNMVVWTGGRRAGKDWTAFTEANAGKDILTEDEYDECLAIRDSVRSHPAAGPLLSSGRAEVSLKWEDEETGLSLKARLDWIDERVDPGAFDTQYPHVDLTDLKTTQDVSEWGFGRTAAKFKYHCQLSFYAAGLEKRGYIVDAVRIIAVESNPPYDCAVYELSADDLYAGECEWRELLTKVADCRTRNEWPGQASEVVPLNLPGWVFAEPDLAEMKLEGRA